MEARNRNNTFYNANVQYIDNGDISIGSFLQVPCSMTINQYMRGDIPLVVSNFTEILLRFPEYLPLIGINNAIKANNSPDFVSTIQISQCTSLRL